MHYGRARLDMAVCGFLFGAAAVHGVYQFVGKPRPDGATGSPTSGSLSHDDRDAPFLNHEQLVATYQLRQIAPGAVTTDAGRPLCVYVSLRPQPEGAPDRLSSAVRRHLRLAELVRLTPPTGECDCHGWVFLGGRGWMAPADIEFILEDNNYRTVSEPHAGDLVLYRDGAGRIRHSGILIGLTEESQAVVQSKWGDQGECVHLAPIPGYGRHHFYRSPREGHRVQGWYSVGPSSALPLTSPGE
jgi:hypothetical protein